MSLTEKILDTACITGNFQLRSGARTHHYFDKYRFESDPYLLEEIAAALLGFVTPHVDFLAGLELGGVPIATALSFKSKISTLFVRKEAKMYGSCKAVEGADLKGARVYLVEDVVTSGGALLDGAAQIEAAGGVVVGAVCVIRRGHLNSEVGAKLNLSSLIHPEDVADYLRRRGLDDSSL